MNTQAVYPRTGQEGPEGKEMYSSTLSSTLALGGMGGQCHAPVALPLGKTWYPLYRRLGGPQGRSGAENFAPTGIRSSDRPVHSQSLHRPAILAHKINVHCT